MRGVVTQQGTDLSAACQAAADARELPPRLLVAGMLAESNLDERAERWGQHTPLAQELLAAYEAGDTRRGGLLPELVHHIQEETPGDISFGLGQQTVLYAPLGDRSLRLDNILAVRAALFDPTVALDVMATALGGYWAATGTWQETLARYNGGPRATWATLPAANRRGYERAWVASAAYLEVSVPYWLIDVRERFPMQNCTLQLRELDQITEVIYHHGASRAPADDPDDNPADELALLDAYHRLHVSKGWCAIAYHLAVAPSGRVYWCNGLRLIAYHATTANATSVGIVFLGDYSTTMPSEAMLAAARDARLWVAAQLNRADLPYRGHKDVAGATACPGSWWPEPGRELLAADEPAPPPGVDELARCYAELQAERSYIGALGHDIIGPTVAEMRAELAKPRRQQVWAARVAAWADRLEPYVIE